MTPARWETGGAFSLAFAAALWDASPMLVPASWNDSHLSLAEAHGIPRERVVIFETTEELKAHARSLLVPEKDIAGYLDTTIGVRIQEDDDNLTGNRVWIFLKAAFPVEVFGDTWRRLSDRGLSPSLEIGDHSRPDMLLRFVMLHEVAHHVLGHPGKDYDREEDEADRWAFSRTVDARDRSGP